MSTELSFTYFYCYWIYIYLIELTGPHKVWLIAKVPWFLTLSSNFACVFCYIYSSKDILCLVKLYFEPSKANCAVSPRAPALRYHFYEAQGSDLRCFQPELTPELRLSCGASLAGLEPAAPGLALAQP